MSLIQCTGCGKMHDQDMTCASSTDDTHAAIQMAKEWAVNAELTGKHWLAEYYTKKAVMLECLTGGRNEQKAEAS